MFHLRMRSRGLVPVLSRQSAANQDARGRLHRQGRLSHEKEFRQDTGGSGAGRTRTDWPLLSQTYADTCGYHIEQPTAQDPSLPGVCPPFPVYDICETLDKCLTNVCVKSIQWNRRVIVVVIILLFAVVAQKNCVHARRNRASAVGHSIPCPLPVPSISPLWAPHIQLNPFRPRIMPDFFWPLSIWICLYSKIYAPHPTCI